MRLSSHIQLLVSQLVRDEGSAKVARNVIANSLSFFLSLIVLLALTPVFLQHLGGEAYGIWMLCTSVLGLAGMLDLGLGEALVKYAAEYAVHRDARGLSSLLMIPLVGYGVLGAMAGSTLFILAPRLVAMVGVSADQVSVATGSLRVVSLAIWPSLCIPAVVSIPKGLQQYGFASLVSTMRVTGSMVGALILLLLFGRGIQAIVTWIVVLHWVLLAVSVCYSLTLLAPYGIGLGFDRLHLGKLLSFSAYSAASRIGGNLFTSGDRWLVGVLLGVESVTYYTVCIGIASKVFSLSGTLTHALMARASELAAQNRHPENLAMFRKATEFTSVVALGLGAVLFSVSWPLLSMWMGNAFANEAIDTLRYLIVVYALLGVTPPGYYLANGIGMPQSAAIGALGGGVLTLLLMIPLSRVLSLEGAALANAGYLLSLVPSVSILRRYQQPVLGSLTSLVDKPLLGFTVAVVLTCAAPKGSVLTIVVCLGSVVYFALLAWGQLQRALASTSDRGDAL